MITSPSNPLVKQARSLKQRKAREGTGLFLVEGIHLVGEAFEAGWQFASIFYEPEKLTSKFAKELLANLHNKSVETPGSAHQLVQPVSTRVMDTLAGKENPQGMVAVLHQKQTKWDALEAVTRGVALVAPQDPGNLGTILRTMDAVGIDFLCLLDGGVDPFHPTAVRASMGALFWTPILRKSFAEFMDWAGQNGFQLIGASAHAGMDYRNLTPRNQWILLLGNEQKGLTKLQMEACDTTVVIPMQGRSSSLNLAVAAGILFYSYIDH